MAKSSNIQLSYLKNGTLTTFSDQVLTSMDGIRIQTSSSSYYLQYRTYNSGVGGFYPYVKSNTGEYAGSSGKPVQRLQIQAYTNDGVKLTQGIVVMYRAYVNNEWLSWVSNADLKSMQDVQSKYGLDGTLDTSSYYAGKSDGTNISGIQILVYEEGSVGDTSVNYTGGEVPATLSYMVDCEDNWNSFEIGTVAPHMDGIRIQTSSNKSYYLGYQTKNSGESGFFPEVSSINTSSAAYAGKPGEPIQRLSIHAYKNDGTKLTSGVIVMYRALVAGNWLPWVSNADPKWMQSAQSKYSLGGTLDTSASYAGKSDGSNISGIEIHIYEDDTFNAGSEDFTGTEINLPLSYMVDCDDNWKNFYQSITASHIDGIRIQTIPNQSFYLTYKTWNSGQSSFYPEVTNTGTGYAGSAGKPIQLLSIHAYKNDGTKLVSGVIVMYRVLVNNEWLPWVSNADPQYMLNVQNKYNLGGTLDTSSSYAGKTGCNISGIQIRVFTGDTNSSIGNLPGSEAAPSLSYMDDTSNHSWHSFSNTVTLTNAPTSIDGLRIQTDPNKQYYIRYKTWNYGQSSFYPEVKSTDTGITAYAGSSGKPIQCLSIHVYANDGTKLVTNVVVMYRAYVDGKWLPWVSNANPDWMESVQVKYNLGGTLDTSGYFAGISGKNISGIEIRVFEENRTDTTVTPTGNYKIIQAPFISQQGFPTGCESVSTVMALNYLGINTSVKTFINSFLYKTGVGIPFDPNISFGGNPEGSGYGCYAPVIKKALDKALNGTGYYAKILNNVSLKDLCSRYIDNNVPVILWATSGMATPRKGDTWKYNGQIITWISPEHCLLLVGYDDNHYIFNDPQKDHAQTYYSKSQVEAAYAGLFSQAVVIVKDIPVTSVSLNRSSANLYIWDSVQLTATVYPTNATNESLTWSSSNGKIASVDLNGKITGISAGVATITVKAGSKSATCTVTVTKRSSVPDSSPGLAIFNNLYNKAYSLYNNVLIESDRRYFSNVAVLSFIRYPRYSGLHWDALCGKPDLLLQTYYEKMETPEAELYMYKNPSLYDPYSGVEMDVTHLIATISGIYNERNVLYEFGELADELIGWLGDLRTLSSDVYEKLKKDNNTLNEENVVNMVKGALLNIDPDSSSFPYVDLLGDVDAVNIAKELKTQSISNVLNSYYDGDGYKTRFSDFVKAEFGTLQNAYGKACTFLAAKDPAQIAFDTVFKVSFDTKIAPWVAKGFKEVLEELINTRG